MQRPNLTILYVTPGKDVTCPLCLRYSPDSCLLAWAAARSYNWM